MTRRYLLNEQQDGVVSVPVAPDVQRAIERATEHAHDALVRELEPFGLSPLDIVIPEFEQVIYEDEVPIFAALERSRREVARGEASRSCGAPGCA